MTAVVVIVTTVLLVMLAVGGVVEVFRDDHDNDPLG